MKAQLFSVATALLLAACGAAHNDSNLAAVDRPVVADRVLYPIKDAQIRSAVAQAATPPAQGLWTNVTVDFTVHCAEQLEVEALSYRFTGDGKPQILFSAFASGKKNSQGPVCQAFQLVEKTITLPGIVALADLELVNLKGPSADVPANTMAINSLQGVKVKATRALCPEGVVCVWNGTIVTLDVTMNSCVNKLGPVAYSVDQHYVDGKLSPVKLAVHAIEFQDEASTRVRCAQTIEQVELTLGNVYGDINTIELQVLGGK